MIFLFTKLEMDDPEFALVQSASIGRAINKFLRATGAEKIIQNTPIWFETDLVIKRGSIVSEWAITEITSKVHLFS